MADVVHALLNPLPFGFFVAALIFDVIYARTADVLWNNGAAWLNAFGLVLAIVPRLINLTQVWVTYRRYATSADRGCFWLYLVAIVVAIFNAFVHSRDAYAVVPAGGLAFGLHRRPSFHCPGRDGGAGTRRGLFHG